MAQILVNTIPAEQAWNFEVTVRESGSETVHRVNMTKAAFKRFTQGKTCTPAEFVKKSFEFLLEKEPKESIFKKFEITVISQYFPEYAEEIASRI